jgi:hypothetical protein
MDPITQGVAGNAIWDGIKGAYRRFRGQRIAITDPVNHGLLGVAEQRAGVVAHSLHGTIKHLRKDHKIWLVVVNESGDQFWPQGFAPVETNEANGTWRGYIHAFDWQYKWQNITITAVIAPPTTQDYFNYFQRVGKKTDYAALSAIPAECKWRGTIQAKLPVAPMK